MDAPMTDRPRSAAAPGDTAPIVNAEQRLATELRDGVCLDPFGRLGPHELKPGLFRLRVYAPGSQSVKVLARVNRAAIAQLQAVDDSGLFAGDVSLADRAEYLL